MMTKPPRMRPHFDLPVGDRGGLVFKRLREQFSDPDAELHGQVRGNFAFVRLHEEQRSLLSPEAMQARERKFKEEVSAAQRRFQERKKALDKSRVEALKTFEKILTEVLKSVRADKKIDIIIKKRPAVIFAHPSVDITGEVLKRIDVRIKKITVKNPGK